jgi:Mg-chelatase subunit ChlI
MTKEQIEQLAARVTVDVYRAVVAHYEAAEHAGAIIGNGHHMAQDIAEKAKALLLERYRKAHPEEA